MTIVARAEVVEPIPAGTFSAPSTTGRVRLDGGDVVPVRNFDGGDVVPVRNEFLCPVDLGRRVRVIKLEDVWYLVAADCP